LKGEHGADLTTVKNIEKKCLNDVVLMMAKGDLVALQPMGQMEDLLSSLPGAEETGVLPILRTIGFPPDVCEFDMIGEPLFFKIFLQDFSSPGVKTEVDVNRNQFIIGLNPFSPLVEKVEE
jgi:hypothetical protein